MSMSVASLKSRIVSKYTAAMQSRYGQAPQFLGPEDDLFQAIAEAVYEEITQNALVNVSVASVTLVSSGLSSSGPGTGTGTIT